MEAIFGDMKLKSFATGSIYKYPEYHHVFNTSLGQMTWGYRYNAFSILCVSEPFTSR